eukprot:snap_masked-scaffold_26-processed-gene-1.23-mRNA-1 protein AED:1.00 eAED:1.00 QI:0/0/0/0/1/1/2/0/153
MFRIFYLKRKGSGFIFKKKQKKGFYIKKNRFKDFIFKKKQKNVQDFIFQEKRFRILQIGIGLKMQLRALLFSAWLGGRVQLIFQKKKVQGSRILYFQKKKVQGSRILYFKKKVDRFVFKKKGSRISDFLLRGWGFGFEMFSKNISRFRKNILG